MGRGGSETLECITSSSKQVTATENVADGSCSHNNRASSLAIVKGCLELTVKEWKSNEQESRRPVAPANSNAKERRWKAVTIGELLNIEFVIMGRLICILSLLFLIFPKFRAYSNVLTLTLLLEFLYYFTHLQQ